jgi:DNA-binding NarL/FixJ family response regulator
VKVLITDDQRVVREGLATIVEAFPDTVVVGLAEDGVQALELVRSAQPDVVLMDLRMPRMDGVEATKAIRAEHPDVAVVVLTTYADDESILAALSAGAAGYLTKDAGRDDIRRALDAAVAGQAVLDSRVQATLLRAAEHRSERGADYGSGGSADDGADREPHRSETAPRAAASRVEPLPDGLTEREAEVLALIADGLSNTEIADRLFVAETTVKTHINRIFAKTQSRDRAQAALYAQRNGLTSRPTPPV